jgi:ABC-type amino acid transport substrate-binding protein
MKIFSKFLVTLWLISFAASSGCSKPVKTYIIGVDPSFFPLALTGLTPRVFAFTNELLQEISKVKRVQLVRKTFSWDNLVESLRLKQCDAILSSIPPTLITESKYAFSKPYLHTGVVLVVQKDLMKTTLKDLKGKMIAMGKTDAQIELISKYPGVQTIFYNDLVPTLEYVAGGWYQGALVPVLQASAYTRDIFQNTLAISQENVLTNEGVRLITLKGCSPELVELFNSGLEDLIRSGVYDALLKKWRLT